jgi:hypothetical protein
VCGWLLGSNGFRSRDEDRERKAACGKPNFDMTKEHLALPCLNWRLWYPIGSCKGGFASNGF